MDELQLKENEKSQKQYRKLERQEGMIAGVCGALGNYFGIDPTILRILFVILLLPGGLPGLLPYFFLWLFIPKKRG